MLPIVIEAKTSEISACNALDKILIDKNLPDLETRITALITALKNAGVTIWTDATLHDLLQDSELSVIAEEDIWYEEFLAMKIAIGLVDDLRAAIAKINQYSDPYLSGTGYRNVDRQW